LNAFLASVNGSKPHSYELFFSQLFSLKDIMYDKNIKIIDNKKEKKKKINNIKYWKK
jgi:hypothetical protein